jgi:16S rRNA (guanine527-N7)-methyltransferase
MSGAGARLNELLAAAGQQPVSHELVGQFEAHVSLILRWNARVNLTAVRDEEGILSRHIIESIIVARELPPGINPLLDFGSGAGFPGIPIALCRPEIAVTLAESQGKKAAFLREAVRVLGLSVSVHDARAETLDAGFICVTMRAVDRMSEAVSVAAGLVAERGWLALMTTLGDQEGLKRAAGAGFEWAEAVKLPGGSERILALGRRSMLGIDSDRAGRLGLGHGV